MRESNTFRPTAVLTDDMKQQQQQQQQVKSVLHTSTAVDVQRIIALSEFNTRLITTVADVDRVIIETAREQTLSTSSVDDTRHSAISSVLVHIQVTSSTSASQQTRVSHVTEPRRH